MSLKSRAADFAARTRLEPIVSALRAQHVARTAPWRARSDRDDRHMRVALAAVLDPTSSAIDVGASYGVILSEIVRLAPGGRHTAYEPRPDAAAYLAQRFPEVDVRRAAASDTSGTAEFTVVLTMRGLSGLEPRREWPHDELETTTIPVTLERLDDVIDHDVSVIKIDVEGHEAACLRGAQEVVSRCRPLVLLEHGGTTPGDPADPDHREVWDLLTAAGLRVFDMDGKGPLTAEQFAQASASGEMWNFLARS